MICFVAWLTCQREDTGPDWYLARSFWRTKSKISTILCCVPGIIGIFANICFLFQDHHFKWKKQFSWLEEKKKTLIFGIPASLTAKLTLPVTLPVIAAGWSCVPSEIRESWTYIYTSTNSSIDIVSSKCSQHWSSARWSWGFYGVWVPNLKVHIFVFLWLSESRLNQWIRYDLIVCQLTTSNLSWLN